MPKLFNAKQIAERSLRKIGAYSINDDAADPEELQETLYWLDLNLAEKIGSLPVFIKIPSDPLSISLDADTASYDLETKLGNNMPDDGIAIPVEAYVRDSSGFDVPIKMLRRKEFDDVEDKDATGKPWAIYLDRTKTPTLHIIGVPTDASYTLYLDVQTYQADLTGMSGTKAHGFKAEWQKWMILATAADIGDGPVRKLPDSQVDRIKRDRNDSWNMLETWSNREHQGVRRTRAWGA